MSRTSSKDVHGRVCNHCKEYKLYEFFYSSGVGKYTTICKLCTSERNKAVRAGSLQLPKRKGWQIDAEGRECCSCGIYKPWPDFYTTTNPYAPYGRASRCATCVSKVSLDYFHDNKEERHAYGKKYREANREHLNAKSSQFKKDYPELNRANARRDYWKNREARRAARDAWGLANPDKVKAADKRKKQGKPALYRKIMREAMSRWRQNNPHKIAEMEQKRRASKLKATVEWSDRDQIRLVFAVASSLKKLTGYSYHVDHVIPLRGEKVCGLHVAENLQIVTAFDNLAKRHYAWDESLPSITWRDIQAGDIYAKAVAVIERQYAVHTS